jgi:hypothetical protein
MSPAQRYLATACAARLSRLREVLDEAEGAGLLLIAGVDSRRHELSIRTLRYLLLGASAPGDEGAIAPDSAIDEVMVLITPTATKLYCPLSSWPLLMPITSAWRDLEVCRPQPLARPSRARGRNAASPRPPARRPSLTRRRPRARARRPRPARTPRAGLLPRRGGRLR